MVDQTKKHDVLMSDDLPTQRTTMFEVERKALHYVMVTGIYNKDLRGKYLNHVSVADFAIHDL